MAGICTGQVRAGRPLAGHHRCARATKRHAQSPSHGRHGVGQRRHDLGWDRDCGGVGDGDQDGDADANHSDPYAVPLGDGRDIIRRLGGRPPILFPVITDGAGDIAATYTLLDGVNRVRQTM